MLGAYGMYSSRAISTNENNDIDKARLTSLHHSQDFLRRDARPTSHHAARTEIVRLAQRPGGSQHGFAAATGR